MQILLLLASLTLPVTGVITQDYSERHPAIDFSCIEGSPVVAAHGGFLTSQKSYTLGNVAIISGEDLISEYAHLASVIPNQSVVAGQQIGTCGSTGQWSTGSHLHFSVKER